jgi:arsenite/tail-anchored protein-transporting ATPase
MTNRGPEYLQNKNLRLIIFGGKGGVGKTTMAAAAAVHLAGSRSQGKKVLVMSTDPAHSLSDSFGVEIGDRVTVVQLSGGSGQGAVGKTQTAEKGDQSTIQNLFARELDAKKLLADFKEKNDAVIKKLAERGTYFDQEDIGEFFDLSLPGMDEVMAIIEIADLLKEGVYDILIMDTAPTGHTVRMLNLPEKMRKWIQVMDLMQHKHRYMFRHFTGKKYVKDACDIFLDDLSSDIDRVKKLLSDRERTRFVPVMIPEPMSIYETEKLMGSLEKIHVPVKELIINRVAESDECLFCRSKREDQKQPLMEIEDLFSKNDLVRVPLFSNEINGIDGLKRMAGYLSGMPVPSSHLKRIQTAEGPGSCLTLDPNLELILFGGKGGVGKTTLASAAALYLARNNPEKKVLLFSTDPAHSLSDSLNQPIGDEITAIQWAGSSGRKSVGRNQTSDSNLSALEIDADRLWADFKEEFKGGIEEMFDNFLAGGTDIKFDREVMTEMLELAPPGLDEIMSLDTIMDLRKERAFDIFVLDTSPTGHLFRFLELPALVRDWLKAFFRLLLKYKGVVRLTGAAEKALALSKNVRRIQESLTDPERTGFVATTIPEAMGLLELGRMMGALETGKIPCGNIIVNMVVPDTDCGFCSVRRAEQQEYIREICSGFSDRTIAQAPLFPNQISGLTDLNGLGPMVFCNGEKG